MADNNDDKRGDRPKNRGQQALHRLREQGLLPKHPPSPALRKKLAAEGKLTFLDMKFASKPRAESGDPPKNSQDSSATKPDGATLRELAAKEPPPKR